ncbi:MAG: glycosyltransferase [Chitinophagaceae bacterium]|nr:MAG: glycosyltransferase [Chitinophagaceae bacterium]
MPRVSVVMPVYNASAFLREAIDSVVRQTFTDWELIVVDDCSTDNSRQIVETYSDQRIRPLYRAQNGGVVAATNDGLHAARGEYIAIMHADDISHSERLVSEVAWLDAHPEHAVVAAFIEMINESGTPCGTWSLDRSVTSPAAIRSHMLVENCIAHSSVLMRGEVVRRYGYDAGQQKKGFAVEDYGLWLELLSDGYAFGKIERTLLYYRMHQQSATSTHLRRNNPYLINYETKKMYLHRVQAKRPLNGFDRHLRRRMYLDYLMAMGKELKRKIKGR